MAEKPTYEELEQRVKALEKESFEQRRVEEELKHEKERLESLIEYSSLAMVTVDVGHNIISCNRDFEKLFYFSESDMIGINLDELINDQESIENARSYTKQILEGKAISGSGKRQRKNGAHIEVEFIGVPVIIDGKVIGAYGIYQDISERKKVDDELRESEKKYRLLAESMADIVWTTDLEFKTTYVSPSVEKILGFTPEERCKQTAEEIMTPDSFKGAQAALFEFLKQEETGTFDQEFITIEIEYYTKNGSTLWMENSVQFIRDSKNRTVGLLGVSRDITLRRDVEEALRGSEIWMRGIFNSLDEAVLVVTPDRKLINANPATSRIFGYSEKELLNRSTEILHVDHNHYEEFGERINQSFIKNESAIFEFEAKRKNGEIFPSMHIVSQLKNDWGEPIGIVSIVRNITSRKLSEISLKESENRYRNVLETLDLIAVSLDKQGNVTFCNDFLLNLTGWKRDEIIGKSWFENFIPQETRNQIKQSVFIKTMETGQFPAHYQNEIVTKNGEHRIVQWNNAISRDSQGNVTGGTGIGVDITDRKRAEEINKALFAISNAVNTSRDLKKLYQSIHHSLGRIIDVTNFFIAHVDRQSHTLHFPYCVDTEDTDFSPITNFDVNDSLTGLVVSQHRPILLDKKALEKRANQNGVWGPVPLTWMGVPLIIKDEVVGVLAVQSYTDSNLYKKHDLQVLAAVSDQVALAIDRKRGEVALRKSEEKVRNILEHSSNLFYSHTAEHELIYLSPQCREFLQCEPEEAMSRWTEFATDNPANENGFRLTEKAIKTGKRQPPYDLELMGVKGRKIWVEVREAPILADGETVAIVGSLTDVTQRKQAEESLLESERKYRTVLEANPDPIVVYDMEGRVLYMNPAFDRVFGWSLDECIGKKMDDFIPEETWPETQVMIDKVLSGELFSGIETRRLTKDGKMIPVSISASFYRNQDGNIVASVINLRDITQQKQLETQLQQSHKMEALGTLSGGIAHEFNNILGIIIGNAELAFDDVPESNPAKDRLRELRTASLRAKNVVRQIMSFSRKTPAIRKPVKISAIIQESLKLIRATIPKNIEIYQELLCKPEMILANPAEINQIFLNLCNNSVHAIEGETGILKIRLGTAILDNRNAAQYEGLKAGEYVKLTVTDNGCGIDPNIMGLIFDPYFTTKDVDEGLGMGLAVVYGIVKKHDGTVRVNSKVGKGTTVEVLFPVTEEIAKIMEKESDDLPRGTERILFIDDEASLVKLAKQMLKRQGYEVVGKTSSTEALKLFQEESDKFDLVITDMAMPKMSGDRLAQELIKIRLDVPIIICTGHSDRIDEEKAGELGVAAFHIKPYDKKILASTVRRVLNDAKSSAHS